MLEGYTTNATVAKIRSIYGRMLTRDDLREMVAKRSVAEVAEYLSRTRRYAEALHDADPNTVHRGMLERLLAEHNFNTYIRLTSFQGLEDKPFYSFLIKQSCTRQLISLVNAVNNGLQDTFVNALPGYLIKTTKLNFLKLARSRNFDELTAALKGTEYFRLFKSFKRTDDGKAVLNDAEVKLRVSYYGGLLEDVKNSFMGSEAESLTDMIKTEIDGINIINAYRLKAYFDYSPDEIRATLLPFSKSGRHVMNKLYDAEDKNAMLAQIRKLPGGRFMAEDIESIEAEIEQRTLNFMRRELLRTNSAPIALYTFMYICNNEMKNIYRIIEGVRYDVDPAMIDGMLIL